MAAAVIDASDLTKRITIKVKGLRVLSVRLWIAAQLFRFAAFVAGTNIEISAE